MFADGVYYAYHTLLADHAGTGYDIVDAAPVQQQHVVLAVAAVTHDAGRDGVEGADDAEIFGHIETAVQTGELLAETEVLHGQGVVHPAQAEVAPDFLPAAPDAGVEAVRTPGNPVVLNLGSVTQHSQCSYLQCDEDSCSKQIAGYALALRHPISSGRSSWRCS